MKPAALSAQTGLGLGLARAPGCPAPSLAPPPQLLMLHLLFVTEPSGLPRGQTTNSRKRCPNLMLLSPSIFLCTFGVCPASASVENNCKDSGGQETGTVSGGRGKPHGRPARTAVRTELRPGLPLFVLPSRSLSSIHTLFKIDVYRRKNSITPVHVVF